ncbi:DUF5681 domain-containing protein [Paraburkholderia sediminicola]|uniref:DUF5681 domain-containing protein n=1 Tax=Paraburkholderia TaxID=1822464 RepID=UPI0038BD27C2
MTQRNTSGRFLPGVSGNPGGRASGVARRIRELLEADVEQFVETLKNLAIAGDPVALKLIFDRLYPAPKAASEAVQLPALFHADSFDGKANALLDAIARGELVPDAGAQLLSALAGVLRVHEVDELARRIAALENPINGEDLL